MQAIKSDDGDLVASEQGVDASKNVVVANAFVSIGVGNIRPANRLGGRAGSKRAVDGRVLGFNYIQRIVAAKRAIRAAHRKKLRLRARLNRRNE